MLRSSCSFHILSLVPPLEPTVGNKENLPEVKLHLNIQTTTKNYYSKNRSKLDHWIMQFESFDWLNHHGICAIIPWLNRTSLVHHLSVVFYKTILQYFFNTLWSFLIKQLFHFNQDGFKLFIFIAMSYS